MVTSKEETGLKDPGDRNKTVISKIVEELISKISSKAVIKAIVRRNLLAVADNKIVLPQDQVDKIPAAIKEIIIPTGKAVETNREDRVDKDKTVTGKTEVVAREVSNKGKIKTPIITAGIKNNEVLKRTSGFYNRRLLI